MSAEELVGSVEEGVGRAAVVNRNRRSENGYHTLNQTDSDKRVDDNHFVLRSTTTMSERTPNSRPLYSADAFQTLGESIPHRGRRRVGSTAVEYRRLFGASPEVSSTLWTEISESLLEGSTLHHLL